MKPTSLEFDNVAPNAATRTDKVQNERLLTVQEVANLLQVPRHGSTNAHVDAVAINCHT